MSKQLAKFFNAIVIPEYARTYTEQLRREYTFDDVVHIAKTQIHQEKQALARTERLLILDTDLIITKVWFDMVYGTVPDFVHQGLLKIESRFHLLLDTSVKWESDVVRENGGEMREVLFFRYEQELQIYNLPYKIISEVGNERTLQAIDAVNSMF